MSFNQPKWIWALVLSLLVHGAAGYLILTKQSSRQAQLLQTKPMKIETMGEKDYLKKLKDKYIKKQKQLVQMDENLKTASKPNTDQRKFLSKYNQVADQNQRAARVGKFKNVYKEGSPHNKTKKLFELPKDMITAQDKAQTNTKSQMNLSHSGRLRVPQPSRGPASIGPQGDGYSATDDYLKDVAIGAQTILNAEEYKFYSFYARIREALTSQWPMRVRQELTMLVNAGKTLTGPDKVTKLRVKLDRSGKLLDTEVMRSSGFHELDRAATEAFKAAAPFPHPPQDMINKEQKVSINWDFIVFAMQNGGVKVQIKRGGL